GWGGGQTGRRRLFGPPAVDDEALGVPEGALVGGEPQGEIGHISRFAKPADGMHGQELATRPGTLRHALDIGIAQIRIDPAWRNDVAAYSVTAMVHGDGRCEPLKAGL